MASTDRSSRFTRPTPFSPVRSVLKLNAFVRYSRLKSRVFRVSPLGSSDPDGEPWVPCASSKDEKRTSCCFVREDAESRVD